MQWVCNEAVILINVLANISYANSLRNVQHAVIHRKHNKPYNSVYKLFLPITSKILLKSFLKIV